MTGVLLLLLVVVCLAQGAQAFGAGNIPSYAYLEGKAFRHGDLEDVLSELFKKAGAGAGLLATIGLGNKFGGLDIKRIYFGNWLRDYSQAFDVAGLQKLSPQAILNLIMVLGFLAHGYATGEFEVTEERIGVYLPVEHIDNPKGYAADLPNQDARQINPKLRPPVQQIELEIDHRTGMKNYIANEQDGRYDTSSACIRRNMLNCIQMGRRARQSGSSDDLYEAYRLLGTFLHTLEDLPAHSNWVELALVKMGHHQVFCHVGDGVKVNSPRGPCPPLVTGTFGGADFLHSLLGEATDHISEASVTDLQKEFDRARSAPRDSTVDGLRDMLFQIPGGDGQRLSREMDTLNRGPALDPSNMSPQELHATLWRILKFRDDVTKSIERGIEKIPGLGSLIERITDSINRFVFLTLEPYVKPIMGTATSTLQQGSSAVVNNADQYAVFDQPMASDPTHSLLSKDHFSQILNEPAGKVAIAIVKHAVKDVVAAWDNPSIDPHQLINNTLQAFHHPFFADSRCPIHNEMMSTVERWFQEQPDKNYILNSLTKEAVRNHKNHRKGTKPDHQQYQSFLPSPQQLANQAQSRISGYANQAFQHVPGYNTYNNMMHREGPQSMPGGHAPLNMPDPYSQNTYQNQPPPPNQSYGYNNFPQPNQQYQQQPGGYYQQGPPPPQMPMPMSDNADHALGTYQQPGYQQHYPNPY